MADSDATHQKSAADYRRLMHKVQQVVDVIERGDEDSITVQRMAREIVVRLRDELGLYGGRLYERDGDSYVLRTVFPQDDDMPTGLRVPRTYAPVDTAMLFGAVYMRENDPQIDAEIEGLLGVKEFAGIEVGEERYLLAFSVAPQHDGEDVLYFLRIVRRAINEKLHRKEIGGVMRQARLIQSSILPSKPPRFPLFDIAGFTSPMESMGGDLFDYIPVSDRILGVAIADASGHGLPAALQVRDVHIGLRMGVGRELKIVPTVERLNAIIHNSTLVSRFLSMFYGELERNGNLVYVNAGHPPPLHLRADGTVQELSEGGPVLGPLRDASYDRGFVRLFPGDTLLLFTDGITEVLKDGDTDRREEFGEKRLVEVLRKHRRKTASEVLEAVFRAVDEWSAGTAPQDDRTAVVVRRLAS